MMEKYGYTPDEQVSNTELESEDKAVNTHKSKPGLGKGLSKGPSKGPSTGSAIKNGTGETKKDVHVKHT